MLTYADVPKDILANLEFRKTLRKEAVNNRPAQKFLNDCCKNDVLFWFNTFCWLFEPRDDKTGKRGRGEYVIPFVSRTHQDPIIVEIIDHLGKSDIGVEKSRDEGASWMVSMIFLHQWLYWPMSTFGIVSKNEPAADSPKDPDSVGWKLDWQLKQLPKWMVPKFTRSLTDHTWNNLQNGSSITGYAATGNVLRGGRKRALLMDELAAFPAGQDALAMASTQRATDCRILVSTPQGPSGSYYEAMRGNSSMKKLRLAWWDNPTRNLGLYHVTGGKLVLDDVEYWAERAGCDPSQVARLTADVKDETDDNPFHYAFMLSGPFVKNDCPRSPWYDGECRRANATPRSIAQELDIDYGGSACMFFSGPTIDMRKKTTAQKPRYVGDLTFDAESTVTNPRFEPRPGGSLLIWCPLQGETEPLHDRDYIIGADIAAGLGGTGSSNSVLQVIDKLTCEQVAEMATPNIAPQDLAWYAIALSQWFRGRTGPALLIPEANHANGASFLKVVRDSGVANVYARQKDPTKKVAGRAARWGFWTDERTKPMIFRDLSYSITNNELVVRSETCLSECLCYHLLANGKVEHIDALNSEDPSGANHNHGDRVMALALAWVGRDKNAKAGLTFPIGNSTMLGEHTVGGRLTVRKRELERTAYW